jgi:hypothetical protein
MLNNKKILYISSSESIASELVIEYANKNKLPYIGLINRPDFVPQLNGVYNTSFLDVQNANSIINLIKYFDHIIYIDLPETVYKHNLDYMWTKHIIQVLQKALKIDVEVVDAENS